MSGHDPRMQTGDDAGEPGDLFVMPASFAQRRLWFLDGLGSGGFAYNVPLAFRVTGRLDVRALERGVNLMIERHETLRTSLGDDDGDAVQIVAERATIALDVLDLSSLAPERRERRATSLLEELARKPFEITSGPLFRVHVLRHGPEDHHLLLNFHHVVFDGWSYDVFARELDEIYTALVAGREPSLAPPALQYADFALWQREWMESDECRKQLDYWRRALDGLTPVELPTDRPRPAMPSHVGEALFVELEIEPYERLERICAAAGCTLFMGALALFQELISRRTGSERIAVGTPIANRDRVEVEEIVGFFVNTLVVATDLSGDPTFLELLARARDASVGAFANQSVPFERVIEELNPERALNRNPLFQVAFAVQNAPSRKLRIGEAEGLYVPIGAGGAKFDLTVDLWRGRTGRLVCRFEYATELFDRGTIERLASDYLALLEAAANEPEARVSTLAPSVARCAGEHPVRRGAATIER